MRRNRAEAITIQEWNELMCHSLVEKIFDVRMFERWDNFASRIYGAKFIVDDDRYESYILYTLVGEYQKGQVLMLERVNGNLMPLQY